MSDALGSVFVIGGESICKRSVVSELLTRGFDVYYGTSESNEVAAVGAQGATVHQFIDGDADSITNTVNTLLRFVSTIDGVIMMPEPGLFGSVEEADVGEITKLFQRNIIIPRLFLGSILPVMRSEQRGSLIMVNRDFSSQILSMNGWMRSFDSGRTALIETLRA